ncbi:MAG: DUF3817 domain-containing protein [Deltaproteobacteria bacterium]|nr:DUF3817 domain-containing protein [Deltaproteobacteria bacterium]
MLKLQILKAFIVIGYFEGISFLLLLGVAMPLKYIWESPEWVRIIGMAHGVLFLLYIAIATLAAIQLEWSKKKLFFSYAAAVLPLGPFLFDKWFLTKSDWTKASES